MPTQALFSYRPLNAALRMLFLAATLSAPLAHADDYSDVNRLLHASQYPEALAKAEQYLASKPRDPQMRFLKGVIQTETGKTGDAIATFTKITEDYPELPEPYNNLAVLYAGQSQFDKARAALEMAIRTNPSYATAHENLGDIYARLASQAYSKALQLDTSNVAAKSKLTLIRTLVNNTATAPLHKNTVVAALTTKPAVTIASPPPVAKEKPVSIAPTAPSKPAVKEPLDTTKNAKVVIPPEVTKKPASVVQAAPSAPPKEDAEISSILNAVNKWASAWSDQDIQGYLGAYGSDFQTPQGVTRKAWSDERRSRIEGKNRISVKINSPKVTIDGDSATVKFRQSYKSNTFTSNSSKTLLMTKRGGKWQIRQERTGS